MKVWSGTRVRIWRSFLLRRSLSSPCLASWKRRHLLHWECCLIQSTIANRPDFSYAAFFFCALNRAHLARVAAAIRFRPSAEILRRLGAAALTVVPDVDFSAARSRSRRARWAARIRARAASEIIRSCRGTRVGAMLLPPSNCSRTEIADSNFPSCCCARLRSSRSCWSTVLKLAIRFHLDV
jgi:hypothetical protein